MSSPPASVEQQVQQHADSGPDDDRHAGSDSSGSGSRTTCEYTNIQELGQLHQLLGVIHNHINESDPEYEPDLEEHRELGIPPGDFLRTRDELSDAVMALSRGIAAGLPHDAEDNETDDATIQLTVDDFAGTACEEV